MMYRLPVGVIARIGPEHTYDGALRQIEISRWLTAAGLPVVHACEDVPQPTLVGTRPVTWWEELPEHRPATPGELGSVLRSLHALRPPTQPQLPTFDPFAGLDERLRAAQYLPLDDHTWLVQRLGELRGQLLNLGQAQADIEAVVHGDAWQGNVAVGDALSPILLDLEHVSRGDPDWDLVPIAVEAVDFARLPHNEYRDFVAAYGGHDVTRAPYFRVFADIQELRWVSFVLAKASISNHAAQETRHRIACLRGEVPRPWTWTAF